MSNYLDKLKEMVLYLEPDSDIQELEFYLPLRGEEYTSVGGGQCSLHKSLDKEIFSKDWISSEITGNHRLSLANFEKAKLCENCFSSLDAYIAVVLKEDLSEALWTFRYYDFIKTHWSKEVFMKEFYEDKKIDPIPIESYGDLCKLVDYWEEFYSTVTLGVDKAFIKIEVPYREILQKDLDEIYSFIYNLHEEIFNTYLIREILYQNYQSEIGYERDESKVLFVINPSSSIRRASDREMQHTLDTIFISEDWRRKVVLEARWVYNLYSKLCPEAIGSKAYNPRKEVDEIADRLWEQNPSSVYFSYDVAREAAENILSK